MLVNNVEQSALFFDETTAFDGSTGTFCAWLWKNSGNCLVIMIPKIAYSHNFIVFMVISITFVSVM